MPRITSRHNPLVARFRAVAGGDAEWMLLDGPHLVAEAVAAGVVLDAVAVELGRIGSATLAAALRGLPQDRVVEVSAPVLDAMSPVRSPGGIVALAARPRHTVADVLAHAAPALVVVAAEVQDPGNVGAIVRAAEAGGATGVIVSAGSADPFGWKALRGAMGSAFRLPVASGSPLGAAVEAARAAGLSIVAPAGPGHTSMEDVDLGAPTLLLLGSEGRGLPAEAIDAADVRLSIPMAAPVESLNVAVAAGVIVYEARRQRLSTTTKVTKAGTKATTVVDERTVEADSSARS
jgi:TrmH family RNA methyltransferase